MAEFETSTIPLAVIAERYLGMRPSTADKKASCGELPLASFRIGAGQKSPRMVHVSDLAELLINEERKQKTSCKRCNDPEGSRKAALFLAAVKW
ncbi:pyocin activator PrtN family protein [Erwinia amylovora]|uniref:pyocin activator PrtN family protein n=1 Tax=Erwinia amylovora TaxID=552 RepID=UPI000C06912F|nr:pyocin activator PrtN family protein [Erwinia amylovora]